MSRQRKRNRTKCERLSSIFSNPRQHDESFLEYDLENDIQPSKRNKIDHLSEVIPANTILTQAVQDIDFNAIFVCSREGEEYAKILKTQQDVPNAEIVVCNDIEFFSEKQILTEWCEVMYLIVDTHFLQIVMRKQRLHNVVYDYFSGFKNSSKVFLVNKMPKEKEWYFKGLKYQLPELCVKDYTEIEVAVTKKQPKTSRTDADVTSPNQQTGDKRDQTPNEPAQSTTTGSFDGSCLQFGDKCAMNITKSKRQTLCLRQDGNDNSINVKIVPKQDVTNLVIVATDPTDPTKERVLKRKLDAKTERINLKLRNSGLQIVDITSGSVIIKLQGREGQYVDSETIEKVINIIFEEVRSETMDFKLDIESSFIVQATDFEKTMTRKTQDLHRNCVNKAQYNDLKEQLQDAEKKLKALETGKEFELGKSAKYDDPKQHFEDEKKPWKALRSAKGSRRGQLIQVGRSQGMTMRPTEQREEEDKNLFQVGIFLGGTLMEERTPFLAANENLPGTWEAMASDKDMEIKAVNINSSEFATVRNNFTKAFKGNDPGQIVRIDRIQSKTLFRMYQAKKDQLSRQNPGVTVERTLWHGTNKDAAMSIAKLGFNRSYCDKEQNAYGEGVYFTSNAGKAAWSQYALAHAKGNRYMFQSKVLTGSFTQGKPKWRVPPPKDESNVQDLYDSVVDDPSNPKTFVIFSDTQAYPEYLIVFQ